MGPRYRVQWGLGTEYSGAEVQSTGAMVQSTQGQSNRVVDNHLCVGQTPAVAHSEGGDKFVYDILGVRMLSFPNHVRLTWGIQDVGF